MGPPGADFVEPDPRGFDRLERFLLQLDRARTLGRVGERAAGDRPVVPVLGALQILERRRVLVLPRQPALKTVAGFVGREPENSTPNRSPLSARSARASHRPSRSVATTRYVRVPIVSVLMTES